VNTNKQQEDIAQHRFAVTFFPNKFATSLEVLDLTLEELAEMVKVEDQPDKSLLPWLKLMLFGDKATPGTNCLRSNKNAEVMTGVVAEHDAGTVSFIDAVAIMQAAAIRCLLYTSPSFRPGEKEKWRIVLPCEFETPLGQHDRLVARVNGLFGGELENT